jgi:hypothetical protein
MGEEDGDAEAQLDIEPRRTSADDLEGASDRTTA